VFPDGATGERSVPLGAVLVQQLAGQATTGAGRPVVVGIRPEHLHLAPADAPGTLEGIADVVEHLGNEQLLYARVPGAMVPEAAAKARETADDTAGAVTGPSTVTRLEADTRVNPGARVTLAIDTDHLHVFDPMTTNRFV